MPFFARGWLFNSSREAHSMPHFSVLAGTGGQQTRVAQNSGVVSRNRQRKTDPNRNRARARERDAQRISRYVPPKLKNQVTGTGVPSRRDLESSTYLPRRVDNGACHLVFQRLWLNKLAKLKLRTPSW